MRVSMQRLRPVIHKVRRVVNHSLHGSISLVTKIVGVAVRQQVFKRCGSASSTLFIEFLVTGIQTKSIGSSPRVSRCKIQEA